MTKTQLQQKYIPQSILLVTLFSVAGSIQGTTGIPFANITIWWFVQAIILYLFFVGKKYFFDRSQTQSMKFVKYYLLWNIISIAHGLLVAQNYWEWKSLVGHAMALLIPIMAYSALNIALMQSILRFYIKYTLPLFAVIFFITTKDNYGFYLVPISFFSLFLPVLTLRWKLIILAITVFVITIDLSARSNVIKFAVPVFLSLTYYLRLLMSKTLLEWLRKLLIIAPILLFCLAVTDTFNVFKMDDYIQGEYETVQATSEGEINENLKADTRTFLFIDVLNTAEKHNSWLFGRSPAKGNESESFAVTDETGGGERAGNEVAILNIFTWTGIVGIVLYGLVFYKASYLAINHSNNFFSKILGLFIAFRWLYAWVEDINYFTLTTAFLWFMLGLCYSKSFRAMNNDEVTYWIRGVFDKRYII